MNTKKIIVSLLAVSLFITLGTIAFAASTNNKNAFTMNKKGSIKKMQMVNMNEQGTGGNFVHMQGKQNFGKMQMSPMQFIDYSKLTSEQKTIVNESQKTYLMTLKQFVASDKQDEFQKIIDNVGKIPEMKKQEGGFWGKFIDYSKLTDDQKLEIQKLEENHQTALKSLMEKVKSATTDEEKTALKTQLDELHKSFLTSLKGYVSSDKLTDFEKVISEEAKGFIEHKGQNFFGGKIQW